MRRLFCCLALLVCLSAPAHAQKPKHKVGETTTVREFVLRDLKAYEDIARATRLMIMPLFAPPPSAYGCDSARAEAIITASNTADSLLTYEKSVIGDPVINWHLPIHIGDDACTVILGRGMPSTGQDRQRVTTANGVTEVWYFDEGKEAFWFGLDGRRWILTSVVQ